MYERFYGFSEAPFNPLPDPSFLYLTPSHEAALTAMIEGVRERRGITVITGAVGIGKTTLVHSLLTSMDEKVKSAFIFFTKLSFKDLLKYILRELGVQAKEADTFALLERFYRYLESLPQDEIVALVIDEAQSLEMDVLKQLLRLWAHPNPRSKLLQTVLVGQPEFETELSAPELEDLRERISVRRTIIPLNRVQSRAYIDHRLKLVGSAASEVFEPKVIERICDFANGIPRVINMVCDTALLLGYAKSARKITPRILKEAMHDLRHLAPTQVGDSEWTEFRSELVGARKPVSQETAPEAGPAERPPRTKLWYTIPAGALLLLIALAVLVLWSGDRASRKVSPMGTAPKEEKAEPERLATVSIVKGTTLYALAKQYYGVTDLTVLDLILEANPKITDVHSLRVSQQIDLPRISAESLLVPFAGKGYKIHLGTFPKKQDVSHFHNDPALKGKTIETIERPVSAHRVWYRVLAGPFDTKEKALEAIRRGRSTGRIVGILERTERKP